MTVVSITTDFGQKDGFVGTMKSVIWKICPDAQIADITHDVPAQDVLSGAIALWRSVPFFPDGSVHLAVVDPGVGTHRRPMAARIGDAYFVAPDNGLLTPLIADAKASGLAMSFVCLDNPEYQLSNVSRTFHGRDIFAPAAAHLAAGVDLSRLGTPFTDPVLLPLPRAERTSSGWFSHITVIDHFGNATLDLHADALEGRRDVLLRVGGREIDGIIDSYGHRQPGELVSVIDSEGFVEVAVVNGSAAGLLGIKLGDVVEIIYR